MRYIKIEVRAARTQSAVLNHQCDIVNEFDTVAGAKRAAKRYLTAEYQNTIESSEPMMYAQVIADGQCIEDYFGKGYQGE